MTPLQLDPDAARRVAEQLRTAAAQVRGTGPLPTGGPPELASYITHLAHAERRLATAESDLLDALDSHAQQVATNAITADR